MDCLVSAVFDFSHVHVAKISQSPNGDAAKNKDPSHLVRQHMANAHLFGECSCHR